MNSKVYFTIEISGVMNGTDKYNIGYLAGFEDGPVWQLTKDNNIVVFQSAELYDMLYMFYIRTKYDNYHEKKIDDDFATSINVCCKDSTTDMYMFSTETCDPDEYLEFISKMCDDLDVKSTSTMVEFITKYMDGVDANVTGSQD
jgi:hypothetical protein